MRIVSPLLLSLLVAVPGWSRDLPHYALILRDPPAIKTSPRGEAASAQLLSAQEAVKRELRSRNFTITGSAHTLLNAIFVAADPVDAADLAAIPGVAQVAPLARFHLLLDRAEQLINVPAAWNLLGGTGTAGAGVKIGIIDTGIEATHPAFQDSSLVPPAGFPICRVLFGAAPTQQSIDCTATDASKGFPICQPGNCVYTNNKVIVARSYVPILAAGTGATPAANSRPDDTSPRDRVGHGTAVAMAAAGTTSVGPSDTITGVAPKAFLGSYKVFGSPGVNDSTRGDAVIQALEDAFNDGMDIVVLSLGAPALSGPLDTGSACGGSAGQLCDVEAYVVEAAVQQGLVVVAAAGNLGASGLLPQPALGTISSPSDAPGAIAVAASTNSHSWANQLTVTGLGTYNARYGDGPLPGSILSGALADVASVGDPLACTAPPPGSLNGLIVLVQRGVCTFVVKIQNLQTAGALAAIITNNPGDDSLITPGGLTGTTIPAVIIGYSDGQTIRGYLRSNSRATVNIDPKLAPFEVSTLNQVAPFSSHGPALGTGGLKPDVTAVGADLYLAGQTYDPNGELYSASGYLVSQGTSFSTPQVAGVAALVKQAHKGFSAAQIKSAVVNTATQDLIEAGIPASVLASGAGKVNAASAVSANLTASPGTVSFGVLTGRALQRTQQIQLTNVGNAPLNLSVAINRRTPETSAHLSIDLPNLTLAPGQTGSINLLLSGTLPAPGIYEGFTTIQGAAVSTQIPWVYIVGDGIPNNIVRLVGDGDEGIVGQQTSEGFVVLQVVDRYGLPVTNLPVTFSVVSGGGQLTNSTPTTINYGLAFAQSFLGPTPGTNTYSATAGGLTVTFQATARLQPVIKPAGAVNGASLLPGPLAPGSYIALFGNNLSDATRSESTPYLPISINQVSVGFDLPGISVPGHLVFVSPGQVNVQIPWELQGQTFTQLKVSLSRSSGAVYTLPLATYSPALFEIASGGQNLAAALDESNLVVTAANPVARGRVVQLFANGLGPVSNQPASGDPAPSGPLAETLVAPNVTIGGLNALVQFSGLTPGYAALYQINVVVPDAAPGIQPIAISIGGVQGPASHIAVK